jgi:hypothetical protein
MATMSSSRITDFEVVEVGAVSAQAHVEDQRGSVANDVAVVTVLDEGRVAEELGTIGRQ